MVQNTAVVSEVQAHMSENNSSWNPFCPTHKVPLSDLRKLDAEKLKHHPLLIVSLTVSSLQLQPNPWDLIILMLSIPPTVWSRPPAAGSSECPDLRRRPRCGAACRPAPEVCRRTAPGAIPLGYALRRTRRQYNHGYEPSNVQSNSDECSACMINFFRPLGTIRYTIVYLRSQHLRGIFSLHMILLHNCTSAPEYNYSSWSSWTAGGRWAPTLTDRFRYLYKMKCEDLLRFLFTFLSKTIDYWRKRSAD